MKKETTRADRDAAGILITVHRITETPKLFDTMAFGPLNRQCRTGSGSAANRTKTIFA